MVQGRIAGHNLIQPSVELPGKRQPGRQDPITGHQGPMENDDPNYKGSL